MGGSGVFSMGSDGGVTKIRSSRIEKRAIFVTPPSHPKENTQKVLPSGVLVFSVSYPRISRAPPWATHPCEVWARARYFPVLAPRAPFRGSAVVRSRVVRGLLQVAATPEGDRRSSPARLRPEMRPRTPFTAWDTMLNGAPLSVTSATLDGRHHSAKRCGAGRVATGLDPEVFRGRCLTVDMRMLLCTQVLCRCT